VTITFAHDLFLCFSHPGEISSDDSKKAVAERKEDAKNTVAEKSTLLCKLLMREPSLTGTYVKDYAQS